MKSKLEAQLVLMERCSPLLGEPACSEMQKLILACRKLVQGLEYYASGKARNEEDVEVRWFGMVSLHGTGGKRACQTLANAEKLLGGA